MSFTYRGLKATLERHIVTDAEIDRQIERLQQQHPRIAVIKDRPTEKGDEVVLDYAGYCDGVQFEGGSDLSAVPTRSFSTFNSQFSICTA